MKLSGRLSVLVLLVVSFALPSLTRSHSEWESVDELAPIEAVAVLHPVTGRKVMGKVHLRPAGDSLVIRVELGGLVPGERYRLRIHEYGDCSAGDGQSAGETFGSSEDLIEFSAGDDGWVDVAFSHRGHSLGGGADSVLGRSVVVHDVRERVGCGTIGVAKGREAPRPNPEGPASAS
jgi:Cu-Zn family superoxide dismutase